MLSETAMDVIPFQECHVAGDQLAGVDVGAQAAAHDRGADLD